MSIGTRGAVSLPVAPLTGALERAVAPVNGERFSAMIAKLIRRRTGDRIWQLHVEMSDDTVRLSGGCASYHVKQLAQHAAMDMVCGATIVNAIDVEN